MNFKVGDKVCVTQSDRIGTITGVEKQYGTKHLWEVDFGFIKRPIPDDCIQLVEDNYDQDSLFRDRKFREYEKFRQFITHKRIQGGLTNIVYSMKYGDVQFLPYQFKPVFKHIASKDGRLLIADEVGLGKTIESLYIWEELKARNNSKRFLVICPAMLRGKWKKDMSEHFGIKGEIVSNAELLDYCKRAQEDKSEEFVLITSLQGVRYKTKNNDPIIVDESSDSRVKLNKLFEEESGSLELNKLFDLVIIDEAQYVINPSSASFKTATRINEITENLILLSATPVNNKTEDLFSLLRLLSPSEYKDLGLFNLLFDDNALIAQLAHLFYEHPKDLPTTIMDAEGLLKQIKTSTFSSGNKFFDNLSNNLVPILSSDEQRRKYYDMITDQYFYSDVFTRSRKRDVMETATREAETVHYEMDSVEMGVYLKCTDLIKKKSIEAKSHVEVFSLMARQRELASCLPAALRRWKEKGSIIDIDDYSSELDNESALEEFESYYSDYNAISDEDISVQDDMDSIESLYDDLSIYLPDTSIDYLEEHDSKYRRFSQVIKQKIKEAQEENRVAKIVVFSFFRNTLKYLEKRLQKDGIGTILIMGGLKPEYKEQCLQTFKEDKDINILLSSEVGAEGLDLQFARIEVNYDLPWNPMKLEQRIGRIDRIGQEADKILILNFLCSQTIEDRILEKLYDKIQIFNQSIGELDEVLGTLCNELEMELLNSQLSPEQIIKRAQNRIDRDYNIMQMNKNLEDEAGLSKAFSDSIIDYVNTASSNNRYIRREDLINYMTDFFKYTAKGGSSFNEINNGVWALELSAQDNNDFRQYCSDRRLSSRLPAAKKVKCCFPQGKKIADYVNIDVNHPIIKWIANITEEKNKLIDRDCCFEFVMPRAIASSTDFPGSCYVFLVSYFECVGIKRKKELLYFACCIDNLSEISSSKAEKLVSDGLFYGYQVNNHDIRIRSINSENLNPALDKCKASADKYINDTFSELEIENEASFERQMAKIEIFYKDKIESRESVYNTIIEKSNDESLSEEERKNYEKTIPMTKTKLENAYKEYEEAKAKVLANKSPLPFSQQMAIGVIFIQD